MIFMSMVSNERVGNRMLHSGKGDPRRTSEMPAHGSDCPTLCSAELILLLHEIWEFIEVLQHQRDVFLELNRLCILERVLQLHQIIFLFRLRYRFVGF